MEDPRPILYVGMRPDWDVNRKRLAGIVRFATPRGFRVETMTPHECTMERTRATITKLRPLGVVAECHGDRFQPRDSWLGRVPAVFFNPPPGPGWASVRRVVCDDAAVARMAFRELAADKPPCYAVITFIDHEPWAIERIRVFRACCRDAGARCRLFVLPNPAIAKGDDAWQAFCAARCASAASRSGSSPAMRRRRRSGPRGRGPSRNSSATRSSTGRKRNWRYWGLPVTMAERRSADSKTSRSPTGRPRGSCAPVDPVAVAAFLNALEARDALPHTILLTLNPEAHAQLAVLAGAFTRAFSRNLAPAAFSSTAPAATIPPPCPRGFAGAKPISPSIRMLWRRPHAPPRTAASSTSTWPPSNRCWRSTRSAR